MAERVRHDHPTVDTIPAEVDRYGGTTRPEIRISRSLTVESGTVVRLVLAGSEYRARIELSGGNHVIRGAYETPDQARAQGAGQNHLSDWVQEREIELGRTVHLDVVEPGFKYGLRTPGEEATYTSGRPDPELADIARELGKE